MQGSDEKTISASESVKVLRRFLRGGESGRKVCGVWSCGGKAIGGGT